jgi:hypothetical protein
MATTKLSRKREICKYGHIGSLHHYFDDFTQSALTDKLTLALSSKLECNVFEDEDGQPYLSLFRPYLNQAEGLIYRMNVYNPPPDFVIEENDIPNALAQAIHDLGNFAMNKIITEAIRRLYESVDHDYFHANSLYGKICWRTSKNNDRGR